MSYSFTSLADGHILILTMHSDFDLHTEMISASIDSYLRLDECPDQVVYISDAREVRIRDMNDILIGAQLARSGESQQVAHHPKLITNFSVVNSKVAQAAVKGLNTASFGFFKVTLFETIEEAVAQAHKELDAQHIAYQ
jgi:hypothetical protein